MRTARLVAGTAAAVVAITMVLAVAVFAGGRNGADEALALSPTPFPYTISWQIAGTQAVEGETFVVSAEAVASGGGSGAQLKDAEYSLDFSGAALELLSTARVAVEDVAEGASWELRALAAGKAQMRIALDYKLSYNITGTPPGSYSVTAETSETVEVAGPPPASSGDVNGDGVTNSIDAALVLQFTAGILLAPIPNSDVNLDGVQDSRDAALILQFEARLISYLPYRGIPPIAGTPIVTASGLGIYDIVIGTGPMVGTPSDTVTVHYTGWLEDGTKFDASRDRGTPAQFGLTQVIEGWSEGIPGMRVGGERRLIIPPHLAYGEAGYSDLIPPNATLVFDIELMSIP